MILCFSTIGSVASGEAEAAARVAKASGLIFVQPLSKGRMADVNILPVVHIDIIQGTQIADYLAQSFR